MGRGAQHAAAAANYRRDCAEACFRTYTGRKFFPLHPDPEQVDIRDIAHALSMQCRFAGHIEGFYSVAQHSLNVATLVEQTGLARPGQGLRALLHDAAEAYLTDLRSRLKHSGYGQAYRAAEQHLGRVIWKRFGIRNCNDSQLVHWADRQLLLAEQRQLFPKGFPAPWWTKNDPPPRKNSDAVFISAPEFIAPLQHPRFTVWSQTILPMQPREAEHAFLDKFTVLYREVMP